MAVDFLELDRLIGHVEMHPEEWDQASWAAQKGCNTTYCLAGWECVLRGHQLKWVTGYSPCGITDCPVCKELTSDFYAEKTVDGELIDELAQRLLGLDKEQATALFYADNMEQVKRLRKAFEDDWGDDDE